MMEPVKRVSDANASTTLGTVKLDGKKLIWNGGMILGACLLIPQYTTLLAICLGLSLAYISLLLGHSVGMHRMMIHRSFEAKSWLKYSLIYIGTLVGIGGPSAVITIHDTRDWAQRATYCHDFFSHRRRFSRDLSWQLFYRFEFDRPPKIKIESEIADNKFLKHLDNFWRWHQLGLGIILFLVGGLPFVVWGIFWRVAISTIGHWSVTYYCHNPGPGKWDVVSSGVQASNLNLKNWMGGWITHGECWHNNHHAFPESARIGIEPGQSDPAWWVIKAMSFLGLANNIGTPRAEGLRDDLRQVT